MQCFQLYLKITISKLGKIIVVINNKKQLLSWRQYFSVENSDIKKAEAKNGSKIGKTLEKQRLETEAKQKLAASENIGLEHKNYS